MSKARKWAKQRKRHYSTTQLTGDPRNDQESYLRTLARELGIIWSSDNSSSKTTQLRSEIWLDSLETKLEQYPDTVEYLASNDEVSIRFALDRIHSDGTIEGRCVSRDSESGEVIEEHKCFIDASDHKRIAGCNCSTSQGKLPCSHTYTLMTETIEQLQIRSNLKYTIDDGHLTEKPLDPSLYKYDPKAEIQNVLAKLAVGEWEGDDHSVLPPVSDDNGRLCWDIAFHGSRAEIKSIYQTPKKRGGGYTKGRAISYLTVRQLYTGAMRPIDEAIVALLLDDALSNSHRRIDEVNARVLELLVGHDSVSLNGNPAQVEFFSPELVYEESDTHCWIQLDSSETPQGTGAKLKTVAAHLIRVTQFPHVISICKMPSPMQKLFLHAAKLPRIPLEFRDELLAKIREMQRVLSIRVPEKYNGKIVPAECPVVVLLRSRANGIMDYGIRVRTPQGKIEYPARGVMVQPGILDGESVQYRRDPKSERQRAHQLCRELSIDESKNKNDIENEKENYDGSIDDFDHGMRVLASLQQFESDGVEVLWDEASIEPMRVLGSMTASNVSVGIRRSRDWFQLSGKCSVGEHDFDLSEILGALQNGDVRGDFVRVGDKGWTRIEHQLRTQLNRLRDSMNQERKSLRFDATAAPAVRELLDQSIEVNATKAWSDCLKRLSEAEELEPKLPENLNAQLRQYQTEGYCWLRRLAHWGVGGILADDMGLGKTLQTLAVLLDRSSEGPALVIAPTSVGFNWVREAENFAPDLKVHLYRETERAEFLPSVGPGDLVVCSYGLALRDAEALSDVEWSTMVLDEAQAVKNSRSKTSLAIAGIPAQWKVALTGTPVENHLGELWSLFRVVSPGVLGNWEQFRNRFAAPIERDDNDERRIALRDRLRPFVLRRTKTEVLKDLPPRTEMNVMVELSPEERKMYDQVRLSAVGELDEIAKLNDVKDQRFRVLALLTRLRQLACSPALVHEDWGKRSAKLTQLVETVTELKEEGHRVLIFSQFVKHLTIIRQAFEEEQISFEYLDGSTPAAERQKCVDRFQDGDATAFLISLKAGGSGLNLTAADYVIHMDPWWNPAVEDQATDRAHRIGQDKPVMVYRMIAQETIEEEILKLHDQKRDLIAGVMQGTNTAAKLTTEDLIAMVRQQ